MVVTRHLTAEDIEQMGSTGERLELADGIVWEKEPMGGWHGEAEGEIFAPLFMHVKAADLGRVYPSDTQFIILRDPDVIHIPDVAFVRADRLPPREARRGPLSLVPDLVVEVISPNDRYTEVMAKVERYQRADVPLIWLVDLSRRVVEIHSLTQPPRLLRETDILDGGDVLLDFSLPVADIFR